jgi:vacuolar-type H+-ATPase subunit D/Vma8
MAIMKTRLKGAQKGHSLLKKKADALTLRFRMILKKIIEVCMRQDPLMIFQPNLNFLVMFLSSFTKISQARQAYKICIFTW